MSKFKHIEKALRENLIGSDIVQQLQELKWLIDSDKISDNAKEVYKIIHSVKDSDEVARISVQRIADKILKAVPTVRKALKELISIGLVEQYKVQSHGILYYKFPQHELMFVKEGKNNE